ncbi:immunity 51 family protein [Streptacidiphilus melanogenes]|uniref:immunity 51 family protein n=1 Tax=Streptacidiphilus melanogenes TaxID=411235 RepID=UPI0005A73D4F|nr:immunity 51 family protein [Streptacidiphilus melanogenes]
MSDRTTLEPLVLFEYDHRPGTYCLMLSDSDMGPADDVFEECGQYGNGYGWEGVARSALRVRAPELTDRISFDSEAGTFVAHGDDPEALGRLGALLQEAWQDGSVLKQFIEAGDPDWFD